MIKIHTSYKNIDKSQVIDDPEAFFNGYITPQLLDTTDISIMKKIDGAEIIDSNSGNIKTPRGITNIDHLSTGCKTVMVYHYMLNSKNKRFLDVSYCGANALDAIFEMAEGHGEIEFILRHKDEVYKCKERDYLINESKHITNLVYM